MQQLPRQENREELKEFRRALRTGNTISVTSRYSEEEVITLLKNHLYEGSSGRRIWVLLSLFSSVLLFQLSRYMDSWPLFGLAILLVAPTIYFVSIYASKSESWKALAQKIQTASLPTLLDAFALGIPDLMDGLQETIASKLPATPDDVLEELTPTQRKQLVKFTLAQMQLLWSKPRVIGDKHAQAAALGYLALATLKHPGAEHPNRRGIEAHHTNLVQAIEEYLIALKAG